MDYYKEALYELKDHFLGKHFYIAEPVGSEEAASFIVERIKAIHPGAGESPVAKYRRRHKKCKWCIYNKHVVPPVLCCPSFCECMVKDKIINENLPRPFCSLFALKKEEE